MAFFAVFADLGWISTLAEWEDSWLRITDSILFKEPLSINDTHVMT
jgi:hypothetical protein